MSTPTPPDHDVPQDAASPGGPASHSAAGAQAPPREASPRGPASVLWPALAIGFAVVSAVLAVLLLRPFGDDGLTTSAEGAAALACEVLDEVDTSQTDLESDEAWVVLTQLRVVGSLAWVATAHDESSYEDFRRAVELPQHAVERNLSMEGEEFATAITEARAACDDIS